MPRHPKQDSRKGGHGVSLQLDLAVADAVSLEPSLAEMLRQAVATALAEEGERGPVALDVLVTSDAEMRELNRQYRALDRPTDVLSFGETSASERLEEASDGAPPERREVFVSPPAETPSLGSLAISLERAQHQAAEYGHSLEREFTYLVVHGVLHLLGYDHEREEDRRAMREREEAILSSMRGGENRDNLLQ